MDKTRKTLMMKFLNQKGIKLRLKKTEKKIKEGKRKRRRNSEKKLVKYLDHNPNHKFPQYVKKCSNDLDYNQMHHCKQLKKPIIPWLYNIILINLMETTLNLKKFFMHMNI
jgi:hypothetical protein